MWLLPFLKPPEQKRDRGWLLSVFIQGKNNGRFFISFFASVSVFAFVIVWWWRSKRDNLSPNMYRCSNQRLGCMWPIPVLIKWVWVRLSGDVSWEEPGSRRGKKREQQKKKRTLVWLVWSIDGLKWWNSHLNLDRHFKNKVFLQCMNLYFYSYESIVLSLVFWESFNCYSSLFQ